MSELNRPQQQPSRFRRRIQYSRRYNGLLAEVQSLAHPKFPSGKLPGLLVITWLVSRHTIPMVADDPTQGQAI